MDFFFIFRYNCNRYNEDDAKKARDNQEVSLLLGFSHCVSCGFLACLFVLMGSILKIFLSVFFT